MADKRKRHEAIRAIIDSLDGSTQEEIKTRLKKQGIAASQSTLSRDLRELGAVKVPVNGEKSVYRLGDSERAAYVAGGIGQAAADFGIECEDIGNFLVIKTKPGNASDFCLVLDRQNWKEIAGTIAGDDTILVIAKTSSDIKTIMEKMR